MPESFGARLRRRREEQGIALATIGEQTKIKLSLLEALERDDVSHWPSGIFRRAYMRAYAHAIGLNPDAVLREFLDVHPEPAEVVETMAAIVTAASGGRPPTRFRHILDSAIGSVSRLRRPPAGDMTPGHLDMRTGLKPCATGDVANPGETGDVANRGQARDVAQDFSPVQPSAGTSDGGHEVSQPASYRTRPVQPDFLALAHLCTEIGRVESAGDLQRLLREAAVILDAIGLIVWLWDPHAAALRPALVHGYADKVLAQLPPVAPDSDNATAAAFRSGQTCAVSGSEHTSGALVVPMLTSSGCAGVLAIETQHRGEQASAVLAAATIIAAFLAQLIGGGSAS